MEDYLKARNYLHKNYKTLMTLFSNVYTQIETEDNDAVFRLSAKAAYYAIVSHKLLRNNPDITGIEKIIKNNGDKKLTDFDHELAVCLIIEGRIHDLEQKGLVKVNRDSKGKTLISLTKKGKDKCINVNEDLYRNLQ
tara:strand:+ start:2407 stop:2817 length:411 start_codon:yes stop_codon:yes gene_type:complete